MSLQISASDKARFWRRIRVLEPTLCWVWEGPKDRYGYGTMKVAGKTRRVHRLSILISGGHLDPSLVVDHICRTRACVNPRHLRQVSNKTNLHENSASIVHAHSLKTHCAKGHPFGGDNLFTRHDGGRGCRQCQRAWGRASDRKSREAETPTLPGSGAA
jgi:hypothetical protein